MYIVEQAASVQLIDSPRGHLLQSPNNRERRKFWRCGNQQVYMVFVGLGDVDVKVRFFCDYSQYPFHIAADTADKQLATVSADEYDVKLQQELGMVP